ncbi:MAG: hypothetical protein ABI315_07950, partial [Bacteroidia bacterium]
CFNIATICFSVNWVFFIFLPFKISKTFYCFLFLTGRTLGKPTVLSTKYKNPSLEDVLYSQERYNTLKEKVIVLWCNENDEFSFQFIGTLKKTNEENKHTPIL